MHTVHHQSQPFLGAAHQEIPGAPPCWPHPVPASCPSAARSGRWPTSSLACQVQAVATLRPAWNGIHMIFCANMQSKWQAPPHLGSFWIKIDKLIWIDNIYIYYIKIYYIYIIPFQEIDGINANPQISVKHGETQWYKTWHPQSETDHVRKSKTENCKSTQLHSTATWVHMKYHRAPFDLNFGERPGSVTEIPQAGVGTAKLTDRFRIWRTTPSRSRFCWAKSWHWAFTTSHHWTAKLSDQDWPSTGSTGFLVKTNHRSSSNRVELNASMHPISK